MDKKLRNRGCVVEGTLDFTQHSKTVVDLVLCATDNLYMVKRTQGMNWIRPAKRLAIYMRDGLACVYCGESVETGTKLTLDHLIPYSHGGSNDEANLVTCCHRCNSSRGNRKLQVFTKAVAAYLDNGVKSAEILAFIRKTTKRKLNVAAASELIAARGGFVNACKSA